MLSLDSQPSTPSVNERRGQQLAPLKTNFSRPKSSLPNFVPSRPQRPRPSEYENDGNQERVPLQTNVKRQTSKSGLRNLFSREKSARKSMDSKLSGIDEKQTLEKEKLPEEAIPLSPVACATPRTKTSTPTLLTSPTESRRSKLPPKHRSRLSEDKTTAEDLAWKPPPLFQAFPQAIKHISLTVPALSADSIVRLHATFKAKGQRLEDEDSQSRRPSNGEPVEDLIAKQKKVDKEKSKYRRALSQNIEKREWIEKIYVLATSGYILQYSGEGKNDRLPERILLLGPKSVAFASDAIPGKHWVLQVSQASEEDNTDNIDTSRPLFSRLGFHRSHARRLARNFLLVFNSPEELSSWLLAVRAQIEARGGKKYVSERAVDNGSEQQLRSAPSVRQMVKRDPNRFSTLNLQPQPSIGSDDKELSVGDQSRRSSYISLHRRSMVMHPPPGSRSESVSTAQTEVMSSTDDTSRGCSVVGSPPLPDSSIKSDTTFLNGTTSPLVSNPKKRRSLYLPQINSAEIAQIPRAQSTVPESQTRGMSPPAPNFSVPSFSRRFTARQDIPQVPQIPSALSDQADDASIDTMSNFPSPPQSPGNEFSLDQRRLLNRQELLKRQLRPSNSEDSIGETGRDRDRSHLRYSRLPIGDLSRSSLASKALHQAVGTPAEASTEQHPGTESSDLERNLSNRDRRRSSIFCSTDPMNRSASALMSRRKSLTGLSIGPPVAPPPNCPLPDIPSTFVKPPRPPSRLQVSPPTSPAQDRRKSLVVPLPPLNN